MQFLFQRGPLLRFHMRTVLRPLGCGFHYQSLAVRIEFVCHVFTFSTT